MFNDTDALVADASAPVSVAVADEAVPTEGVALTVTVVSNGTSVPEIIIVTGLTELYGRITSGEENDPFGATGTFVPPTDTMVRIGIFVGTTE